MINKRYWTECMCVRFPSDWTDAVWMKYSFVTAQQTSRECKFNMRFGRALRIDLSRHDPL